MAVACGSASTIIAPYLSHVRFINWFVHRFIHKTRGLKYSLHFTSRAVQTHKIVLALATRRTRAPSL